MNNPSHATPASSTLLGGMVALTLVLASCQSPPAQSVSRASPANNLSGGNTLSQVAVRTSGEGVNISGTTIRGRRIKASGATTSQAVKNLETAAGRP